MSRPTDNQLEQAESILGELESLERQLDALQHGLTRSHRLTTLGTIATIIAHEYNNILTPVISYCQLAAAHPDDAALQRKALARALAGAQKAAEISSSILGFARDASAPAGAGDGGANGAHVTRIADAVADTFATLGRDLRKDGIAVSVHVPEGAAVSMGRTALHQVLLNLVLNARRAMLGKGGTLRIEAAVDADEGVTRLTVADSGPGIPAEIRDTIFLPFVTRKTSDDAEQPAGTGLGLAICRDLVKRAGGAIDLTQTGPTGTVFTVTLTTAEAASNEQGGDGESNDAGSNAA